MPPRSSRHRLLVAIGLTSLLLAGLSGVAADSDPAAEKKIDWAAIDGALAVGEYAKAAAMADKMAQSIVPRKRDPDFLTRSIELIRLLMRRGVAELRLGRLNAADATLEEAFRLLKDEDFRQAMSTEARSKNPGSAEATLLLDLNLVELLNLRMTVILEQLWLLKLGVGQASGEQGAALAKRWNGQLDLFQRTATRARNDLAERFDKAGPAIRDSIYYRSLSGRFRSFLVSASKNLGLGAVATDEARRTGEVTETAAAGQSRTAETKRLLAEAAAELDKILAAIAPAGVAALAPEARREVALLRADLLTCEGMSLLEGGEPASARERFADVISLRREAGQLLNMPQPDAHPDLFVPFLLSAAALLDESQAAVANGDSVRARDQLLEASQILSRSETLTVPKEHPLQAWRRSLGLRLTNDLASLQTVIPRLDAADAMARRMRRAIDGTASLTAGEAP